MNIPILIHQIYGIFTLTGLYSFEFVDKNRNTITEIFFMIPPKNKTVSESTRSATVPTLSGNYNLDAGNSTKDISLSGTLFFPYVGSPNNPVARDNAGLENNIDGLDEFFKLRFVLMRYRDYTMTKNAKMTIPSTVMNFSPETAVLYQRASRLVKSKIGALYDQIQLIFHDYDMDDHWFARVKTFTGRQADTKYNAVDYEIEIECYEPDTRQHKLQSVSLKPTTNEQFDTFNSSITDIEYSTVILPSIQKEIGNKTDLISLTLALEIDIANIDDENVKIQSGQSTALTKMPIYISTTLNDIEKAMELFLETFLSAAQRTLYDNGDLTLDEIVNIDLISFWNCLQKIKLQAESMQGVINSIPVQSDIRYYADADDYKLTTEQFEATTSNKIENKNNFYYYTIMDGDSARLIALRELKDPNKFSSILRLNNITENELIDGTLIGQQIKIPLDNTVVGRGEDNLVFEADYTNVDKYLYGCDLATDINSDLIISGEGDLWAKIGIENVYDNVDNRIKNRKGTLNVFNPNWGSIAIDEGNAPFFVKLERYLTDVIEQIQSDPRVESVKMDLKNIKIHGEVIETPIIVYFVGTEETREVIV